MKRLRLPTKICTECKKSKLLTEFQKYRKTKTNTIHFRHYCMECQQIKFLGTLRNHAKGTEGIRNYRQLEYFEKATRPRPERCEACNGLPTGKKQNVLSFDHDKETGLFRGWLCNNCNMAIGLLRHDHRILLALAHYLYIKGDYTKGGRFVEMIIRTFAEKEEVDRKSREEPGFGLSQQLA